MEIVKHDIKLKEMSDEEIRLWAKCLSKDNVVLLKDQDCSKEDLVRIYDSIGRVAKPVDRKTGKKEFFADDDYPQLMRVTNERKNGEKIGIFADKELGWHSNGNARNQGKECSVALYCVKEGTDSITSFVDMRQSYRDLPDDIKNEVDNIECLYKFKNGTFYDLDDNDKELEMFENRSYYINGVKRKLVYQHPYDNTIEWDWLNKYLMEHCFQDKYITHHSWEAGDLIFMDQFHSLHKRNEVKGERLLYRSSMDYKYVYKR